MSFAEFHQLSSVANPTPDSLQHQVFERGFIKGTAERSQHCADKLICPTEVARCAMSALAEYP
jgi:hypothetical protein